MFTPSNTRFRVYVDKFHHQMAIYQLTMHTYTVLNVYLRLCYEGLPFNTDLRVRRMSGQGGIQKNKWVAFTEASMGQANACNSARVQTKSHYTFPRPFSVASQFCGSHEPVPWFCPLRGKPVPSPWEFRSADTTLDPNRTALTLPRSKVRGSRVEPCLRNDDRP